MAGNQIIKFLKYVSWLMSYHNMIWVLHLNKSGLGNIEPYQLWNIWKQNEIHNLL
jgi:hypothetical protein